MLKIVAAGATALFVTASPTGLRANPLCCDTGTIKSSGPECTDGHAD